MRGHFRLAACFIRDGRGFTRLEVGLLSAMLGAMVVNGIASLGGGLGNGSKPIGTPVVTKEAPAMAEAKPPAQATHTP